MVNMLFWFIAQPTDTHDTIKTIVTSMAAVLTTTMTLRIILSVRGSLAKGGSFAGSSTGNNQSAGSRGQTTHVISTRRTGPGGDLVNISGQMGSQAAQTYTLDEVRDKPRGEWTGDDKSSVQEAKDGILSSEEQLTDTRSESNLGVKITIDRHVD